MSSKRFGAIFIDSTKINVWQPLFEAAPMHDTTAVVVFCNQSTTPVEVSMAYTMVPYVTTFGPEDIILNRKLLGVNETYVFPAIAIEAGANIQVLSNFDGVSIMAHGYQEAI